jgi:cytochrome c biogenesis protein CcmG/thiol:disulfide interchange protein DsbE
VSNRPNKNTGTSRVAAARGDANRSRTLWIVIGVVIVVVVAGIVAIAASGSKKEATGGGASPSGGTVVPAGDLNFGTVDVSGTALVQLPARPTSASTAATPDPAVGVTIPTVTGQQFDGSGISIGPGGKAKVVMFVAHWCPHCQAEVPRIQQWLDAGGMPADVDLYTVATGTSAAKPNYPPGGWLRGKAWSVPTMVDDKDSSAGIAFGLSAYPFFVVVDSSGKVVTRTSGEVSEATWNALLEAARTGVAPATSGSGESSSSN